MISRFRPSHYVGAGLAVILIGIAGWALIHRIKQAVNADFSSQETQLSPSVSSQKSWVNDDFASMKWDDIPPIAEALGGNDDDLEKGISQLETVAHPQAQYLRALMLLAEGEPHSALLAFNRIEVDQIPGLFLYAPHRLQRTLFPGHPSPYRKGLEDSLLKGELPPLIEARYQVMEGRLSEGLTAFSRTDPADWTNWDARSLRALYRHSGLRPDVIILVQGALRAGRVPPSLQPELADLISGSENSAAEEENLLQDLVDGLRSNTEFRKAAIKATARQLEIRQAFASRDYSGVLEKVQDTSPLEVTDETALLALLSAAQLTRQDELDRWSQEIRRRYPSTEVKEWLSTLKPATP